MKLVLGLFGLENFYGGDISSYIEISQMGEELGFDSVSVTDHVVMGKNLHKYPFGKFLFHPKLLGTNLYLCLQ